MTELRQRQGKPYRNKKHLQWVAQQPCMICYAHAQCHHLLRPWIGPKHGTGMRCDDRNGVPLCPTHHRALHDRGDEDAWFFESPYRNESAGRGEAERLWLASPYGARLDQTEKPEWP